MTTATTSTTSSASSASTTSSTSTSTQNCDVDGDGYLARSCGGNDCNDLDAHANPGVQTTWIYLEPTPVAGWVTGDWNCDDVVESQYPGGIDCPAINVGVVGGSACSAAIGFTGTAPPCGSASPTFVQCQAPLLGVSLVCATGTATSQAQGCR